MIHICIPKNDGSTEHTLCGAPITYAGVGYEVARRSVVFFEDYRWCSREWALGRGIEVPSCFGCCRAATAAKLPPVFPVDDPSKMPVIRVVDLGD